MLIMGEGADDDLWVTFQITAWLQECFGGCFAWSGTRAAWWRPVLPQFFSASISNTVSCSSLDMFSALKLGDVWRTGRVQEHIPEVHKAFKKTVSRGIKMDHRTFW